MTYLKELKKHELPYNHYREIRRWLKNYFYDLKVNTASSKKITLKREDIKIKYVIEGNQQKPTFLIVKEGVIITKLKINKKNLPKIGLAIDDTVPSTLNKQCMTFNARLSNAYSKKRYDEMYLLNMADWQSAQLDDTELTISVDEDYVYKGDSKSEIRILKYLLKYNCVKLLRGQDYAIEYDNKKYYPDFVYLNHLNQIVILEVKAKMNLSAEKNLKKHIALAKHCEAFGYVYGIMDLNFNTLVSMLEVPINKGFEKEILRVLEDEGVVTSHTITQIRSESFQHIKRKTLEHMIPKIVITNKRTNRPKAVHDLNIVNKKSKLKYYYLLLKSIK